MKKNYLIIGIILVCFIYIYFFPKSKPIEHYKLENSLITVVVEGEVNFPGTYVIEQGKTIGYLINLAGGLTKYADISNIDLKQVVDKTSYQILGYKKHVNEIILKKNLNEISYEELIGIPYINEDKALEILMYRKQNNGFKSVNELIHIKGIGEKTLEKLKDYFTV